jgi:opacity protein-like surface antigen
MKKIILALCLSLISSVFAFAQTTSDYKKSEFFVGYSNGQVDTGADTGNSARSFFDDRLSFHGFNASAAFNFSRYVGAVADVSGTYRKDEFNVPVTTGTTTNNFRFNANSSLYNVLGGVQVKDNASTARVKPFGYALVGAGFGKIRVSNVTCPTGVDCSDLTTSSETGLAGAFGGGIDIKITDRVDFRAIKVDYNPIKFDDGTQHNVRIGIGVVFK